MTKNKKLIIYYLANKYNLPLQKIEKIMKEGKFESVRLPYFGKFSVNPKRLKHMNKNDKTHKDR